MRSFIAPIILSLGICTSLSAQHLTHDIGFHLGTSSIRADYGVRNDFFSNFGNTGTSISISHSVHFFKNDLSWNYDHPIWSHLAIKSELGTVTKTNLKHYGSFVESNTLLGRQLEAMTGSTSIFYIGFQMEYYIKCLRDFMYPWTDIKWNPYILAGIRYNSFKNDLNSSLGEWREDISVLPTKWQTPGTLFIGKGTAFSAVFGSGLRYRLTSKFDLNTQFSWNFFFSDAIDGLQANVVENQNNEWSLNFQIGVIYHLNFSRKLSLF